MSVSKRTRDCLSILAIGLLICLEPARIDAVRWHGHAPRQQAASPATIRSAFLRMIGRSRVPLDAVSYPRPDGAGLLVEEISFDAEVGARVPGLVFKRKSAGKSPAVVVLHGTGGSKEGMVPRLRELATRGFVAVAIDGRHHGARAKQTPGGMSAYQEAIVRAYRTGRGRPFLYDTVWDVMRLIDYLETRDDVDASRIGVMGISKGGMETYLAAAIDPRIATAVPLIGVQSFGWGLEHGAWDSRAWTLREALDSAAKESGESVGVGFMRKFYDRVAPGVHGEFDGPKMLPLIAPRPLLIINGDSDPRTPVGGVRECMAAAEQAYKAAGASDRLVLHLQPNTGHQITPEGDRAALAWFERWLKPAAN